MPYVVRISQDQGESYKVKSKIPEDLLRQA